MKLLSMPSLTPQSTTIATTSLLHSLRRSRIDSFRTSAGFEMKVPRPGLIVHKGNILIPSCFGILMKQTLARWYFNILCSFSRLNRVMNISSACPARRGQGFNTVSTVPSPTVRGPGCATVAIFPERAILNSAVCTLQTLLHACIKSIKRSCMRPWNSVV